MLVEDELQSSSGVGILGSMNYEGSSIGQAFACVYHQIQKLKIPHLQYRIDLAEQSLKDFRELRQILSGDENEGWIGTDLDGTLAKYSGWSEDIGEPIGPMISKVKRWLAEGKEGRILTARGSQGSNKYEQPMN